MRKTERQIAIDTEMAELKKEYESKLGNLNDEYNIERYKSQCDESARELFAFKQSLVDAGFTEIQAYEIVMEALKGCKK